MGSYWRINKIKDYNPVQTDRLTKVVLYKIIDLNIISKYLVEVPTSNKSCPVDMVSKKTPQGYVVVSPSGKEVNTDCCKQVGGTFVNGMCFLKIVIPPIEKDGFKRVPLSKSSIEVIPTIEERGPLVLNRYLTSRNAVSIESFGSQNYIQPGSKEGLIIGSNSSILNGIENAVIIGDGITADENGSVFIGAVKINKEGNILHNGLLIIDGGLNEVFNYAKTNPIEVVDGTFDSVRNPGGSSYSRPIIDGGQKS
jgi:hypothetical protein